jgi:hypothetical protein
VTWFWCFESDPTLAFQALRFGVKDTPRLLTDVTIAAKLVVTLLETVINKPTVAIYPTWRTSNVPCRAVGAVGPATRPAR